MSVLGGVWPVQAMACDGLRMVKGGTVVNVVDGDTVLLDSGMVVRLIGIQAQAVASHCLHGQIGRAHV